MAGPANVVGSELAEMIRDVLDCMGKQIAGTETTSLKFRLDYVRFVRRDCPVITQQTKARIDVNRESTLYTTEKVWVSLCVILMYSYIATG